MTGRGQGFCVLTTSKGNTRQIDGFVGIDGKPIRKVDESVEFPGKEVTDMPAGDGTGASGMGPMTGRAAGFCAGFPVPGYMNPVVGRMGFYGHGVLPFGPHVASLFGYGVPYAGWPSPWLRRGVGFGQRFGRGRGGGWGRGRGRFGHWW
jgi:hypothetical protein